MDWEARHVEAHRRMMDYYGDPACELGGPAAGARMGMGPGQGSGMGPGAMTPEQYRGIMEMQMQLMREQLASQPAAK